MVQVYLFIPKLLQKIQLDIFVERVSKYHMKYSNYIPLAWTIRNNTADSVPSTEGMLNRYVCDVRFEISIRFMEIVLYVFQRNKTLILSNYILLECLVLSVGFWNGDQKNDESLTMYVGNCWH